MIQPTCEACTFSQVYNYFLARLRHAPAVNEPPHQMEHLRDNPMWVTRELLNCSFQMKIPRTREALVAEVQPSLPWAEAHFAERVSGIPHNPPPSHTLWPYGQKSNAEHLTHGKFSHTYPERMWPKDALRATHGDAIGIRFRAGDLQDLVRLLIDHPNTRQAYLPIWFPEDLTAANRGERVPCTLGYHFLAREGRLNLTYFIRSCDLVRFFRDDVYMACRLAQWVVGKIHDHHKPIDPGLKPGNLTMHIVSLHCFEGDIVQPRGSKKNRGQYASTGT